MKVNKWMLLLFMTVFLTTSVHNRASASDSVPKVDTSGWVDVKKPAHLPILMYHSISRGTDSLHVPKEQFREQMKWLKRQWLLYTFASRGLCRANTEQEAAGKICADYLG